MDHSAEMRRPVNVQKVASAFDLKGGLMSALPFGGGHINETYLLEMAGGARYILQKINGSVFPDPAGLMGNMERVTGHLAKKLTLTCLDVSRRVLDLMQARDGRCWIQDESGNVWRCTAFISDTHCLRRASCAEQAFEAGRAFGEFQALLADLPGPRLQETIPGFHAMPLRLTAFLKMLEANPSLCSGEAHADIAFALENKGCAQMLAGLNALERVTHNDAKLENLLFDDKSGKALCVIDLDTVMPGIALYDFGDLARSASCIAAEGEKDPRAFQVDRVFFAALAQGFLDGSGGLTRIEREHMVEAAQAFAYTLGLRFLTDHLSGNRYFRVAYPGQNLERARGQFALLRDLQDKKQMLKRSL